MIVLAATALAGCGGLGGPAGGTSPLRTVTGGRARAAHRLVRLVLHAGSADPGSGPWQHGDAIRGCERRRLAGACNAGFTLDTGAGGWQSGGHVAVLLTAGRAAIVTYRDGTTDIGTWQHGIPTSQPIVSVRQNLSLLVDNGVAAATVNSCIETCWGATIGGAATVARSALGINANRRLIYAATPSATPATLAQGLIAGGVRRATELDINPDWVAAYLYHHGRGQPEFLPAIPGPYGVAGHFLAPYTETFSRSSNADGSSLRLGRAHAGRGSAADRAHAAVAITRATDGTERVLLINDSAHASATVAVGPLAQSAGNARVLWLRAPRLSATSGITLGGRSFGASTESGALPVRSRPRSFARPGVATSSRFRPPAPPSSRAPVTTPAVALPPNRAWPALPCA